MGEGASTVGLLFALQGVFWGLSSLTTYTLHQVISTQKIFLVGYLAFAIASLLLGPSHLISLLPQSAWVIGLGICLNFYTGGSFSVLVQSETMVGV
jgi:cyanate permease